MAEFKRQEKYLVLKQEDIVNGLSRDQKANYLEILDAISAYRWNKLGKTSNKYVVVNQDEPYSEIVWKLIELSQTHPEHMKALIDNIQLEFDMEEHLGSAYL